MIDSNVNIKEKSLCLCFWMKSNGIFQEGEIHNKTLSIPLASRHQLILDKSFQKSYIIKKYLIGSRSVQSRNIC